MEWNKTAQKNPHNYGQLIDKTKIYNGEKTVSSMNCAKETGQQHIQE